jgi:hypothetical protein
VGCLLNVVDEGKDVIEGRVDVDIEINVGFVHKELACM